MALAKPSAHFTLRLYPSHFPSQQNDSGSDLETSRKYHPKVYRENCHSQLQPLASADYNTNDGCKKSSAIVVIIWKAFYSDQSDSSDNDHLVERLLGLNSSMSSIVVITVETGSRKDCSTFSRSVAIAAS